MPSIPCTVVPLTQGHYSAVEAVWEASVRSTHAFLREDDLLTIKRRLASDFLPAVTLYGVFMEGSLAGFAGTASRKLEMLFIAPYWQGRGLGRRLVESAIRHEGVALVDVNEQNPRALAFYRHMGFEMVGRSERDGMGMPYPLLHMMLRHEHDQK